MAINNLLISKYLESNHDISIDNLKTNLSNLNISVKDYKDENLLILYNNFTNLNKRPIELECRSVIIDRSTFNIINYTCPTPIYNIDAMNFLLKNCCDDKEIFECYEGSLMSIFSYNDIWYMASRRKIHTSQSNSEQFSMFLEVLNIDGYKSFDNFCQFLDKNVCYYFVLIHHKNKNIVKYEEKFGENYKKLCLIFCRDKATQEELSSFELDTNIISENIFLPEKLDNESEFDKTNKSLNILDHPKSEGIIIKTNNKLLKLQNLSYQFFSASGPENDIYRGFIKLYQVNQLKKYFNENSKYAKIVNPCNTQETFDTLGTIDAIFRVFTSELLEIFNSLYDENGNHKKSNVYSLLPISYKNVIFKLKGIFYKNKNNLTENNVYNYLKKMDSQNLINIIMLRRLLLNLIIKHKTPSVLELKNCFYKQKKVLYKLTSIYTNKLFPQILPNEIPNDINKDLI
jgi:hypothetical protein